jgi:hypothetical protein
MLTKAKRPPASTLTLLPGKIVVRAEGAKFGCGEAAVGVRYCPAVVARTVAGLAALRIE